MSNNVFEMLFNRFTTLLCVLFAFVLASGCSKAPSQKAKLPLGAFDFPSDHAYLKGVVKMSGWALSEDGINSIMVFVDRSFSGYGRMSGPRPDVVKIYTDFANATEVGWTAELDTNAIPEGAHMILVRAVSHRGAVRDLGNISGTIEHEH